MDNTIEAVKNCRACGANNFVPILSLGNQFITNFVSSEKEQGEKVPLDLILCNDCKVMQLRHSAPPEAMWGDQYWYKSGISSTIKADLKDIAEKAQQLAKLNNNDIVIDIGCNDGTMLDFYKGKNLSLVGFEPSKNVAREASAKGHKVINDFFNAESFKKEFGNKKAKIITAISMFYDLEDPNKFLKDIVSVMDKEGIFIIQQNYLLTMLEQNAFDNICHEHREYYSVYSLKKLLNKHNLEIFDAEQNSINGGSVRTYIRLKNNKNVNGFSGAEERLKKIEEAEMKAKLDSELPYRKFASRVDGIKNKLMDFLKEEKKKGKKIWIYGASTRGNVILQYFGLGPNLIDCIADMNPDKWGKKTVGSLIPIDSPKKMREANPDFLVVNTWHFLDEIVNQEKEYFNKGGKFVVALPDFKTIDKT
ncbi:MAG: class I SAM-dependent methyltransferase [Nanoarchaeota archaeon]